MCCGQSCKTMWVSKLVCLRFDLLIFLWHTKILIRSLSFTEIFHVCTSFNFKATSNADESSQYLSGSEDEDGSNANEKTHENGKFSSKLQNIDPCANLYVPILSSTGSQKRKRLPDVDNLCSPSAKITKRRSPVSGIY